MERAIDVLVWTCVGLFVATAFVSILALVGTLTLGGQEGRRHDYYLKRLFVGLIMEVVATSVVAYAAYIKKVQVPLQTASIDLVELQASVQRLNTRFQEMDSAVESARKEASSIS